MTMSVAQPAVAGPEAMADRTQSTGRGNQNGDAGGGFSGLLSKLAGAREPGRARDAESNGGESGRRLDWLADNAETAQGGGPAERLEEALTRQDGAGGGLTDIDVQALLQILNGSGALAGANGFAGIAGRLANGTATHAETELMQAAAAAQENGETLSSEQRILAALAKSTGQTGMPPSEETTATTATLTVLRRETHLAPVAEAGWTARLAAGGINKPRAVVQPGTEQSRDDLRLLPVEGADESELTQLANPQAAVTSTREGELGPGGRREPSPIEEMQAVADATSGAAERASVAGRADVVVNAGVAPVFTQQIADRVISEATTLAAPPAGQPDASAFHLKHESALKVLHIQLQPADLGVVTIRMSVKDNALRLDLETGRAETAGLIQRDRDALSALLRSAGYLIDGMEVRVADPNAAGAPNGSGPSNTPMQGGGQSGSWHAEGRSSGERRQDGRDSNPFGNGRAGENEQAVHPARNGGIYI